jgi:hypothetical protein
MDGGEWKSIIELDTSHFSVEITHFRTWTRFMESPCQTAHFEFEGSYFYR